jgi:two-component system, OmpR family, osmolarity sensor histidine kinase EnvZ
MKVFFARVFAAFIWLTETVAEWGRSINHLFNRFMPKGLYVRSLIIVMMPTFALLSVATYIFLERHWQLVTEQLARATARDVAFIAETYHTNPDKTLLIARLSSEKLELNVEFLPLAPLPPLAPRPFFDPLDKNLSSELTRLTSFPFWIDTVSQPGYVKLQVNVADSSLRISTRRGHSYASSSPIFLAWLLSTCLVVLTIALLFLRNQIRPILSLAEAAQAFGKGRDVEDFRPRGAREVRAASTAFIDMKRRIERQIDQRTTMLAGISHDLRTILTRFKLELALLPDGVEKEALQSDTSEMAKMVETYLAFAKGEDGEQSAIINIVDLLKELQRDAERLGHATELHYTGDATIHVRPHAFKRALTNLVMNAGKYGHKILLTGVRDRKYLTLYIDDDGPGVPLNLREDVFKPFYRIDSARNLNVTGTGLGLSIARDIVRGHGGDITLENAPIGGLRATIKIPI